MNIQNQARFNSLYQRYLHELTLQGKSPKTINSPLSHCKQHKSNNNQPIHQLTLIL
ncbi:hypothetical protein [Litoribacillus peritrichatus]|uniref:hypothetical protein n=1 Tax=Litoribacillus peritrichatus TaxID=718191 RepID=UPI0031CFF00C